MWWGGIHADSLVALQAQSPFKSRESCPRSAAALRTGRRPFWHEPVDRPVSKTRSSAQQLRRRHHSFAAPPVAALAGPGPRALPSCCEPRESTLGGDLERAGHDDLAGRSTLAGKGRSHGKDIGTIVRSYEWPLGTRRISPERCGCTLVAGKTWLGVARSCVQRAPPRASRDAARTPRWHSFRPSPSMHQPSLPARPPMSRLTPFHLAFPVHDLAAARAFYGGCWAARKAAAASIGSTSI